MRQPSWRKRVPNSGKRVRASPLSDCYESHKKAKLYHHNICEGLGQSHAGSLSLLHSVHSSSQWAGTAHLQGGSSYLTQPIWEFPCKHAQRLVESCLLADSRSGVPLFELFTWRVHMPGKHTHTPGRMSYFFHPTCT